LWFSLSLFNFLLFLLFSWCKRSVKLGNSI
jgi:hypothetical protein